MALFGIPLQQTWSYGNTGDFAPTYYLQTDAPLYYYSFTDAFIAMAYRSLPPADRARFDPMITGFNPADMYAAEHIKRVLQTFPGVFSGIGEFTIHKEFVSSKIAGETASLTNPALDAILEFAGEVGLVVILHNDVDLPFPKPGQEPYQSAQLGALLRRHPQDIDHLGPLRPGADRPAGEGPALAGDPGPRRSCPRPRRHRPLLGRDGQVPGGDARRRSRPPPTSSTATPTASCSAPTRSRPPTQAGYLKVYDMYAPLFAKLTPEASEKVRKGNYERLFDEARRKVRAWEKANVAPQS